MLGKSAAGSAPYPPEHNFLLPPDNLEIVAGLQIQRIADRPGNHDLSLGAHGCCHSSKTILLIPAVKSKMA